MKKEKSLSKIEATEIGKTVDSLYETISAVLEEARNTVYRVANTAMTRSYWNIGRVIVEEEQSGKERAEYGTYLIKELAKRLTDNFGKGFTRTNLFYMKQFYLAYPKVHALRGQLTWTHYRLLLKVENEEARNFYEAESVNSNWSTRELERQINSLLFERLAMSKDKDEVLELAKEGQILREPKDLIKDPFVLEFLGLSENKNFHEKELEQELLDKLQDFMLELGKGFAFVARQKRITIDGEHFRIDLVFYNYLLKCFVLIDLKLHKLTHKDIGQMDFYVRYFEKEERSAEDNPTIGLIMCSEKNDAMVRYTLLDSSKQLFASRYKLHLPTEEELRKELERERNLLETEENLQN